MTSDLLRTRICDELGIRYPIFLAGMSTKGGLPTPPALVAAVSEAGGLGVLGCSYAGPEEIRARIRGVIQLVHPGDTVRFPAATCAACPLRIRCTTSTRGRTVSIHPDERLRHELRTRQQTPEGRATLRERVRVEHSLAHVGQWQGPRARYRGDRTNVFDLRRVAVVHTLHVLARLPADTDREAA